MTVKVEEVIMSAQCKDIPDLPVLSFLLSLCGRPGTIFPGFENSVQNGMPPGTPEKLARAKMKSLIKRKLVSGCYCGCRGDFELTDLGICMLASGSTWPLWLNDGRV